MALKDLIATDKDRCRQLRQGRAPKRGYGMSRWRKGTVCPDIRGKDRSETETPCLINFNGTLAVHRYGPKSKHWTVTHVLSGLGVTGGLFFNRQSDANAYAADLYALAPTIWSQVEPEFSGIGERWRTEVKPKYARCG